MLRDMRKVLVFRTTIHHGIKYDYNAILLQKIILIAVYPDGWRAQSSHFISAAGLLDRKATSVGAEQKKFENKM